jgi:hypothetical protein
MPLPFSFGPPTTTATGTQLDGNFAAVGALTPIPCTVAGTNALTFTPAANTPSVVAYSNFLLLTGVAGASNTTAATARCGALAALNVYKDSSAGPVALTAGDIVAGNFLILAYDAALNSGAGGFHLTSASVDIGVDVYPVIGSSSGLQGSSPGSATTASWTATELVAGITLGGTAFKGSNLSFSFSGGTTGANGLDTGAMPASAQLAVYAIYNPTSLTWATLGYAAGGTAAPMIYLGAHMPSGYTYSALLWAGVTTSGSQLPQFQQVGGLVYLNNPTALNGATAATSYTSLSLSGYIPLGATGVWGVLASNSVTTNAGAIAVSFTSAGVGAQYVMATSTPAGGTLDGFHLAGQFTEIPLPTAQTIWWKATASTSNISLLVGGYRF